MSGFTPVAGGVTFLVRVTARGRTDAIEGWSLLLDGREALSIRVRAIPSDGRANEAVAELLASRLDVPRSKLTLLRGASARLKTFRIAGDPEALTRQLGAL